MDRKELLGMFNLHLAPREAAGSSHSQIRRPDVVYQAAMAIRGRIDAALAASRRDSPPDPLTH